MPIREAELRSFWEVWNNYPDFKKLPESHQARLVQLCEKGLHEKVCQEYSKTHAELNWSDQELSDSYSSRGGQILANLDLNSSFNQEWLASNPNAIETCLAARTLQGYLILHGLGLRPPTDFLEERKVVDPEKLSLLSGIEMNQQLNEEYLSFIKKRSEQTVQRSVSRMYKCSRCHANETIEESKQERSLDEPNTVRRTCVRCGKTWKDG